MRPPQPLYTLPSINAPKEEVVKDFTLRGVSGNVAMVEGPDGLYRLETGETLPGGGRVVAIEWRQGHIRRRDDARHHPRGAALNVCETAFVQGRAPSRRRLKSPRWHSDAEPEKLGARQAARVDFPQKRDADLAAALPGDRRLEQMFRDIVEEADASRQDDIGREPQPRAARRSIADLALGHDACAAHRQSCRSADACASAAPPACPLCPPVAASEPHK